MRIPDSLCNFKAILKFSSQIRLFQMNLTYYFAVNTAVVLLLEFHCVKLLLYSCLMLASLV